MNRFADFLSSCILLSVFIFCFISDAQAGKNINTVSIPFTQVGSLIIVTANADGFSGNFILDTGSEFLLLNKQYVKFASNKKDIISIGNTGKLIVGEMHVNSLHIDQMQILDLKAHIVDLHPIEVQRKIRIQGVLGFNAFKNFEMLIDFPHHMIVLSKVNKKGIRTDQDNPSGIPYDSMYFTLEKHLIVIKASVNGVILKLYLDTGAEFNLIDKKINKRAMKNFTAAKQVIMVGIGNKKLEATAGIMNDVQCGHQFNSTMNTILTNMDDINSSFQVNVDGVLGYEFLKQRIIMINYQKKMLYFFRSGK